jgi:serine/threonine-protein kinase haspin
MLGTRTKQVFSYGRRNQRVVNATDERDKNDLFPSLNASTVPRAPVASRMRKREDLVPVKSNSPIPRVIKIRKQKKKPSLVPSPPLNTITAADRQACVQNIIKDDKINYPKSARLPLKHNSPVDLTTPPRPPLCSYSINAPGSPAIISGGKVRKKPKARGGTPLSLKRSFAPFVDVEILVLDDDGRRVSQERRKSRTRVITNPIDAEPRKRRTEVLGGGPKPQRRIIPARDEGEPLIEHIPVKRVARKAKPRVIISDESESDGDAAPQTHQPEPSHKTESIVPVKLDTPPPRPRIPSQLHHVPPLRPTSEWELSDKTILSSPKNPHFKPLRHRSHSSRIAPINAPPPLRYQHFPSPVSRPRQLTPIRNGAGSRSRFPFQRPVLPSPSTPSDLDDLSFECPIINLASDLTTSGSSTLDRTSTNTDIHADPQPEYLMPLLEECAQESCGPHEFSAFIEMFPMDPIVWDTWNEWAAEDDGFRKIGEASYSEVFGIGDVVLKIVPLRDETPKRVVNGPTPSQARNRNKSNPASYGTVSQGQEEERDGPPPSDAKDVLKEVIVTRAMGDMCEGFVKLLKAYVVRGRYPEILLKLWDDYFERKGSENVRPGASTPISSAWIGHICCRYVWCLASIRHYCPAKWWA